MDISVYTAVRSLFLCHSILHISLMNTQVIIVQYNSSRNFCHIYRFLRVSFDGSHFNGLLITKVNGFLNFSSECCHTTQLKQICVFIPL